ncbi:MAG: S-layer homology domain-containing protein [Sedimentibacter sp.]|uniref:S-layer homology domain-containing protein n=1 Tax=Sedimentibacter sp. TaxID=1960295 RepID=UPI002980E978|nr:S-layer homology domain-containing protein [Sedimentibacter sp.]MDW5299999.1 S-layer homology domain-containing protein [Sedimentibacter sp.]
MRKTYFVVLLTVILIFTLQPAFAETLDYTSEADKLNALGLFKGTSNGYELDRVPNRAESAAMLVRLLGAEEEANKANYSHPFTDVPEWANPIVGYMYEKGLTKGIGNNLFGASQAASAKDYSTFMLRTLGYDGDFNYNDALPFAAEKGILTSVELKNLQSENFKRNEMVLLSYNTLKANLKSQELTLAEFLVNKDVLNKDELFNNGISNRIEETILNLNSSFELLNNNNSLIQVTAEKANIQVIPSENYKETLEAGFEGTIIFNNHISQWEGLNIKYELNYYYKGEFVKTSKYLCNDYSIKEKNEYCLMTPYDKFDEIRIVAYPLSIDEIKKDFDGILEIVTTNDSDKILDSIVKYGNFSGVSTFTGYDYTTYSNDELYELAWFTIYSDSSEYSDGHFFEDYPYINRIDKTNADKYYIEFNEKVTDFDDDKIVLLKSSNSELGFTIIHDNGYKPVKIYLVK